MKKLVLLVAGCGLLVGCAQQPTEPAPTTSVDGSQYLLSQTPDGAKEVIQVREEAQDGDPVVIVGRIGGSVNPWIDDRAVFTIVDNSLQACSDIPDDSCEKPWDYCCETDKLSTSTALVKVVDENGKLVAADARQLLNVKELSTVVVTGTAQRDENGNLTVLADGIFVKK